MAMKCSNEYYVKQTTKMKNLIYSAYVDAGVSKKDALAQAKIDLEEMLNEKENVLSNDNAFDKTYDMKKYETAVEWLIRLKNKGLVVPLNGNNMITANIIKLGVRYPVVMNINGKNLGFYQSTEGTDGKTAGTWYPMFGTHRGWIVKGGTVEEMRDGYNDESIQKGLNLLNRNLKGKDSIALSVKKTDESIISKNVTLGKVLINRTLGVPESPTTFSKKGELKDLDLFIRNYELVMKNADGIKE